MEEVERLRAWTYRRQFLGRTGGTVESVLGGLFGVYSAHPTAPLSLWARCESFDAAAYFALEASRRAVRVPAMRNSIFLLGASDAALAVPALLKPPRLTPAWARYLGTTAEAYPAAKAAVLDVLGDRPLSPAEVDALLSGSGVVGKTALILRQVAHEAEALRVGADGLRSNALRYVATSAWMPALLASADPDAALALIAGRYLAAYGPARVEDFRWWAGVTKTRAARAVASVDTVLLEDGLLLPAADLSAFQSVEPLSPTIVDILPKWDAYTMGHEASGRSRFVAPSMQARVFSDVGDGLGTVLVGGCAAAAWSARFDKNTLLVNLDAFDPVMSSVADAVQARFAELASVLGADDIRIMESSEPLPETTTTVGRRRAARRSS